MFMTWTLLLLFVTPSLAQLEAIDVFYRPIDSGKQEKLGVVTYNLLDKKAGFVQDANFLDFEGLASVGFEDKSGQVHYSTLGKFDKKNHKEFVVHLFKENLLKIDYSIIKQEADTTSSSDYTHILLPEKGPQPSIKEPIIMVGDTIPEPVPEKTFLQKYWLLIVPILLLTMGGGGQN